MNMKMYIEPKVETIELKTAELMVPGGGSPTDGSMDPAPIHRD